MYKILQWLLFAIGDTSTDSAGGSPADEDLLLGDPVVALNPITKIWRMAWWRIEKWKRTERDAILVWNPPNRWSPRFGVERTGREDPNVEFERMLFTVEISTGHAELIGSVFCCYWFGFGLSVLDSKDPDYNPSRIPIPEIRIRPGKEIN
jgi:hypothetical protein